MYVCCRFFYLLAIFFVLNRRFKCQDVNEKNLVAFLMTNYNNQLKPSSPIILNYIFFLNQIVSIDDKNQIMTSSANIYVYWVDPRLSWTPASYGDLQNITIQAKKVWLPDLVILNSADTDNFLRVNDQNMAFVDNSGEVNLIYSMPAIRTRCKLNVRKFPFDQQNW
jgi:hypothetical protein